MDGRQGHRIDGLGHGKQPFEIHHHRRIGCHRGICDRRLIGARRIGCPRWIGPNRQLLKNAATAVVNYQDRQLTGQLAAPQPAVGVVQQGQVAADQHGSAAGLGHPAGQRQGAIDARGAPKGQHRSGRTIARRKALPIPHRRTIGQHQRHTSGQEPAQLAGQSRFAEASHGCSHDRCSHDRCSEHS